SSKLDAGSGGGKCGKQWAAVMTQSFSPLPSTTKPRPSPTAITARLADSILFTTTASFASQGPREHLLRDNLSSALGALLQGGILCKAGAMRTEPQLRVRVVGDEIVVTLPGYHYAVTYSKPSQVTGLIARSSPLTDDPHINEEIRVPC